MTVIENYIDNIDNHLQAALSNALILEKHLETVEGDSDLYRKIAFYLSPSLNHWLIGAQAGNIKDLRELLARRASVIQPLPQPPMYEGNGHEVVTKKK